MKKKTDFFIGLALLVFCGVMAHQIYLLPPPAGNDFFTAGSFPTGVTAALAVLSLLLVFRSLRAAPGGAAACWPEREIFVRVALMGVWIILYVIGFIMLGDMAYEAEWPEGTGFTLSTLAFLVGAQFITGYRNIFKIVLISIAIAAFLYVVFAMLFKVPLP